MRSKEFLVVGWAVYFAIGLGSAAFAADRTPIPTRTTAIAEPEFLNLDAALLAADTDNIDLIRARLAVKAAQANLRIADTAPNPNLNLNAVQIRPSQIGVLPANRLVDTIVSVDLPLERGGKRRARVGQAQALIDAAHGDLSSARRDMREAVFDAYYDLKAAEQRADLLAATAGSYAESQRLARTQLRAGSLPGGDLATQEVEASRAATDAAQALIDLHAARLALAILIGRDTSADAIHTNAQWPDGPPAANDTPAELLAMQRPDVLAAQARVDAARRNLDSAHAQRHPDVTVSAQYERSPDPLGVGNSVGFGVSVPLPIRNGYSGEVDAASTALTQAETEVRKAITLATAEISIARQTLSEVTQLRDHIEQVQLPAARKAASVAEFAYAHGASSLLDLLNARRSLRAVELGAIDARAAQAHAIARLVAAETTGDDQ